MYKTSVFQTLPSGRVRNISQIFTQSISCLEKWKPYYYMRTIASSTRLCTFAAIHSRCADQTPRSFCNGKNFSKAEKCQLLNSLPVRVFSYFLLLELRNRSSEEKYCRAQRWESNYRSHDKWNDPITNDNPCERTIGHTTGRARNSIITTFGLKWMMMWMHEQRWRQPCAHVLSGKIYLENKILQYTI